jgi:GNAT superfamily N-acetyltransferase
MSTVIVAGVPVRLRLLERSDANLIRAFYQRLSPDSVYRRFFGPVIPPADRLVKQLTDIDHNERDALIALDLHGICGIARYGSSSANGQYDLAVTVADEWQGKGLGRLLTSRLAHIARFRGISSFHATMMGSNYAAQAMVRSLSPQTKFHFDAGYLEADIPLRPGVRSSA